MRVLVVLGGSRQGVVFGAVLAAAVAISTLAAQAQQADPAKEQITVKQTPTPSGEEGDKRARGLLAQMVTALGGDAWLSRKDWLVEGRTATFFKNEPTGVQPFWNYHRVLDAKGNGEDRLEFTKKRDVIQIWNATNGYELTYKGKKELPKDIEEDYFRRLQHSIEKVVLVWLKDPQTIVVDGGTSMVQRRAADKVTVIDSTNDSVTLELDANTHLPLRRTFEWRNATYKDRDEDVEEYSDYHDVQGLPTPYTITRYHNGDMVSQRFITKRQYNISPPATLFDLDQPYNAKHK